jgi:hypothetical protein
MNQLNVVDEPGDYLFPTVEPCERCLEKAKQKIVGPLKEVTDFDIHTYIDQQGTNRIRLTAQVDGLKLSFVVELDLLFEIVVEEKNFLDKQKGVIK